MKTTRLNVRISERRLNKLRLYATSKDKTVTQIVEDACWQVAQHGDWQFLRDQRAIVNAVHYRSLVNSSLPRHSSQHVPWVQVQCGASAGIS